MINERRTVIDHPSLNPLSMSSSTRKLLSKSASKTTPVQTTRSGRTVKRRRPADELPPKANNGAEAPQAKRKKPSPTVVIDASDHDSEEVFVVDSDADDPSSEPADPSEPADLSELADPSELADFSEGDDSEVVVVDEQAQSEVSLWLIYKN